MSLTPGASFGPYEIIGPLGAGGMGAVYRARDSKLNRDVAIKVLLPEFAGDPDRLARFRREAQLLAALNHTSIGHIYGLYEGPEGDARDGQDTVGLVLEYVDGPTLADLLAQHPSGMPFDDALSIARQIAEALQAAHEQGIIHRDLKPANIKVRADGTVKVLDFGLAKFAASALDSGRADRANVSLSPTITSPAMTAAGFILGTAAYMAPEQAKGRDVDKRADLWAFGCVLYEMLTGVRPFVADDVSDTLARVLLKDPDWTALPATTPSSLLRLLKRCLEKDPRRRLDSAFVARLDLEESALGARVRDDSTSPAGQHAIPGWKRWLPWSVAAVAILAAATSFALWAPWQRQEVAARQIFEMSRPGGMTNAENGSITLSRTGRYVVIRRADGGTVHLWVRPTKEGSGAALRGSDNATSPFFSFDEERVAFYADGKLKALELSGGPAQTIADSATGQGGDWNASGTILFTRNSNGPIYKVQWPAGEVLAATTLEEKARQTSHRFPQFLPDGVHFIYLALSQTAETAGIYVGSLGSLEAKRLVPSAAKAMFAAPDVLVFLRDGALMAQRLDMRRLELIGSPVPVAEGIGFNVNGGAAFSLSQTGLLMYSGGGNAATRQLAWRDRKGEPQGVIGTPMAYENPRLSPDGKRLAVFRPDNGGDIWITDLEHNSSSRFTFNPAVDNVPLWAPRGDRIAFISNRDDGVFNIYAKNLTGDEGDELLLKTPNDKILNDWSPDGKYILYQEADPKNRNDLWMLPLEGDRQPIKLLATPYNEQFASFSPDGKLFAYESDDQGSRQVFVRPVSPSSHRQWQVSVGRLGAFPRWRPDGKEMFYDGSGVLMAVDILSSSSEDFAVTTPHELFRGLQALPPHNLDVTDNGQRFLVLSPVNSRDDGQEPFVVIVNWMSGLGLDKTN